VEGALCAFDLLLIIEQLNTSAKVADFCLIFLSNENVLGFNITVNNAFTVNFKLI
jgi:hypothetical protein